MLNRVERMNKVRLMEASIASIKEGYLYIDSIMKAGKNRYRSVYNYMMKTEILDIFLYALMEVSKEGGFAEFIMANARFSADFEEKIDEIIDKLNNLIEKEGPGSLENLLRVLKRHIENIYPGTSYSKDLIKGSDYSMYTLNKTFVERIVITLNLFIHSYYDFEKNFLVDEFDSYVPVLMTRGSIQTKILSEAAQTHRGKSISAMYKLYAIKDPRELSKNLYLLSEVVEEMCKEPFQESPSSLYILLMYIMKKLYNNRSYLRMYAEELDKDFKISAKYLEKATGKDREYILEIGKIIKEKRDHVLKLIDATSRDVDYLTEFGLDELNDMVDDFEKEAGIKDIVLDTEEMKDYTSEVKSLIESSGLASKAVSLSKDALRKLNAIKYKEKKFWNKIDGMEQKLIDDWKASHEDEYNEKVINGSLNIMKALRKLSIYAGGFLLGGVPQIISIIGLVAKIATHKKAQRSARIRVINELEIELKIVQEKIRDSERDDNKEAKYKLMRLEAELQKNLAKVKHSVSAQR